MAVSDFLVVLRIGDQSFGPLESLLVGLLKFGASLERRHQGQQLFIFSRILRLDFKLIFFLFDLVCHRK